MQLQVDQYMLLLKPSASQLLTSYVQIDTSYFVTDASQNEKDVQQWSVKDMKDWAKENHSDVVSVKFESKLSIHADSLLFTFIITCF